MALDPPSTDIKVFVVGDTGVIGSIYDWVTDWVTTEVIDALRTTVGGSDVLNAVEVTHVMYLHGADLPLSINHDDDCVDMDWRKDLVKAEVPTKVVKDVQGCRCW